MSATPTDGLNSVNFEQMYRIAQAMASIEPKEIDYAGTRYTLTDQATGTTTTTMITYSTDGNKIADGQGNTWLHVAAHGGSDEMINGFITKGGESLDIDIRNREDKTPLMIAVMHGRQKAVEVLLENGADIDARIRTQSPEAMAQKDKPSLVAMTALRIAVERSDIPMVRLLLKKGVSLAEDDKECNPLHYALVKANADVVRALIEAGCDPHRLTSGCSNAFHFALPNPDLNVIRMLLTEFHVNPNQKNISGYSPLRLARNIEVVKLLLDNGAQPDGTEFPQNGEQGSWHLWDKVIALLEHGVVPAEPPTSKDHPFAAVVISVEHLNNLGLVRVAKLTRLYLAAGAIITSERKEIFEAYFSSYHVHTYRQDPGRYPEFQELKKLVRENSPSCVIS